LYTIFAASLRTLGMCGFFVYDMLDILYLVASKLLNHYDLIDNVQESGNMDTGSHGGSHQWIEAEHQEHSPSSHWARPCKKSLKPSDDLMCRKSTRQSSKGWCAITMNRPPRPAKR